MEVKNVILTEFDEEAYRKSLLDEGREEGLRMGRRQKKSKNRSWPDEFNTVLIKY